MTAANETLINNLLFSLLSMAQHLHDAELEVQRTKAVLEELYMLNNIIKYAPDMIYWKDKNSIHLGCNDQFALVAGYKNRDEVIGKSDRNFPWHLQADKYQADDRDVIATGESRLNIEDIMSFHNGKQAIVITNKVPLRNREGTVIGVLGIATDITQQKTIEQDLKKAKDAAEAANIAKTEFIANMSHDIRTPLSGIVGLGGIVEQQIQNPEIKAKVHDMVRSADELLNMLNEILDVASLRSMTVNDIHEEVFDLHYLVQSIIDLEQSSVDLKQISLTQSIDANIPHCLMGDHKKIHHILLNLVGNAIKFTHEGRINIHIQLLQSTAKAVELGFEVSDTGMGIPADSLDKIFEVFYKISPSYKGIFRGHGVGLHIVKSYIDLLGGKIQVESELNKGSRFFFNLNLQVAPQKAIPQNIIQQSLKQRSQKPALLPPKISSPPLDFQSNPSMHQILIIEDNDIARMVVQTLVTQAIAHPTMVSDAEKALELIKTQHFDLILSDVGLPGMSGIEFVMELRRFEQQLHSKPTPIVAITGHADGKINDECLAAGFNEVIIKPIRLEILEKILQRYCAQ